MFNLGLFSKNIIFMENLCNENLHEQLFDPLLSVIIPCWNGAKFLPELLDSFLRQTYTDWRVFVVDDQSTDDSVSIIKDYCARDNRIICCVRDTLPKGAQTCRNIGLEKSKGSKYVMFLDCDDVVAPYCFEQRVNYMECHKELDFAVFPAQIFHKSIDEQADRYIGYKWPDDDLEAFLTPVLPFVVWNNIYRRDSLLASDMTWDTQLLSLQDSDFNIQCILRGLKYEYAKGAKVDYFWRVIPNSGSITQKIRSESHYRSHVYLNKKILKSLSKEQIETYSNALGCRMVFFADIFRPSKHSFIDFINSDYLKSHPWLKLRISLYRHLPNMRRYRRMLFPSLTKMKMQMETLQANQGK